MEASRKHGSYYKRSGKQKTADEDVEYACYYLLRPLAVLASIVGTFPVSNLLQRDGRRLYFSTWSSSNIFGYIFFSVVFGILGFCTTQIITDEKHTTLDNWKIITGVIMFIRSFFQFLFCHIDAKHLPKMMKMLEKSYFCRMECRTKYYHWHVLPFLSCILLMCYMMAIDYFFYRSVLPCDQVQAMVGSIMYAVLRVWQVLPIIFCCVFISHTARSFAAIHRNLKWCLKEFKIIISSEENNKFEGKTELLCEHIEWLQVQHGGLVNASYQITKCYGTLLVVDYFVMVALLVVNLYIIIAFGSYNWEYILSVLNNLIPGLMVQIGGDRMSQESQASVDRLRVVSLRKMNEKVQDKLENFLNHILANPAELSAAGFFLLDKTRIVGILASVSTYLVVLLQSGELRFSHKDINGTNYHSLAEDYYN